MQYRYPHIIDFSKFGSSAEGYISVAEVQQQIPFDIKRIFWTYFTPESVVRGRHAHHHTEMVLIAAAGRIIVETEMPDGHKEVFLLDQPNQGVFLPVYCWHTMQYSHSSIQLVLASTKYDENDYIRNYDSFQKL